MHRVVPHGFAAYTLVFHPAAGDRPRVSASWCRQDKEALVDFETECVPWRYFEPQLGNLDPTVRARWRD